MSQLADPIRICLGMSKIVSDLDSGPSTLRCARRTETGRFKLLCNTDPHPGEKDLAEKWSEKWFWPGHARSLVPTVSWQAHSTWNQHILSAHGF